MDSSHHRTRLHQTALRPELLPAQVHKAATDAMRQGLEAVIVPGVWVRRVATMLQGSGVRTHAAVGFPHGTSKSTVKAIEATSCIKDGADAVWVVPHLPSVLRGDLDAMKFELLEICRAARATRRDVAVHVVLEWTMLVTEDPSRMEEIIPTACRASRESGCDGVVTCSGFHVAGDTIAEAVRDLRAAAEGLLVIANGGIDTSARAIELFEAGADRVGSERAADIAVELVRGRAGP